VIVRSVSVQRLLPVAGSWGSVLSALVPLALVVALSPITVIPAVLLLQAPRARPNGLAFLGGWLLGLAALTAASDAASGAFAALHKTPPTWASWLRVALGLALIGFGVYRWLTRHRDTDPPRWMRSFSNFTPARAALAGAVLAVIRPEVVIICAAAGLAIGTSTLATAGEWLAAAFFVALAASTVAVPVLAYVAAGERLDNMLSRLKDWMEQHHGALLAAVLIVIGLMVLYKGIHAL